MNKKHIGKKNKKRKTKVHTFTNDALGYHDAVGIAELIIGLGVLGAMIVVATVVVYAAIRRR